MRIMHIKSLILLTTISSCYYEAIADDKSSRKIVIIYSKGVRKDNKQTSVGTVVVPEPRFDSNVFIVYPQTEKITKKIKNEETSSLKFLNIQETTETATNNPDEITTTQNEESLTTLDTMYDLMDTQKNTESNYMTTEKLDEFSTKIGNNEKMVTTENIIELTTIIPENKSNKIHDISTLTEAKPLIEPILQSATKKIETFLPKQNENQIEVLPSQFEPVISNEQSNIESAKNNELDSIFQTSSIISRDLNRRRKLFNRRISTSTYYTPTFSVTSKILTTTPPISKPLVNITENFLKNDKRKNALQKPLNSINFVSRLINRSKSKSKFKPINLEISNKVPSFTTEFNKERTNIIRIFNKQKRTFVVTTVAPNINVVKEKYLDNDEDSITTEWKAMKIEDSTKRPSYRGRRKFSLDKLH